MGYLIVDGHCDSILDVVRGKRSLGVESSQGHLDFPRMKRAGVSLQFFAAFIESAYKPERSLKRTLQIIDVFFQELEANQETIALVTTYGELVDVLDQGKMAALLAIEGGEALADDLGVLRVLHRLGVRSLGLTWNQRNSLADGVAETDSRGGLTNFGHQVVREMNKIGMLVDVSHISAAGFWDVLQTTTKPIIASHSNAYSVCNHPRNLTDAQIKALAQNGGVMGMNFAPDFISPRKASLACLLDHIDYIADLVGVDNIGLGSDFDGIDQTPLGLEDVTKLPYLIEGLNKRGYSENDVKKILGQNFLRVIKEVLPK